MHDPLLGCHKHLLQAIKRDLHARQTEGNSDHHYRGIAAALTRLAVGRGASWRRHAAFAGVTWKHSHRTIPSGKYFVVALAFLWHCATLPRCRAHQLRACVLSSSARVCFQPPASMTQAQGGLRAWIGWAVRNSTWCGTKWGKPSVCAADCADSVLFQRLGRRNMILVRRAHQAR